MAMRIFGEDLTTNIGKGRKMEKAVEPVQQESDKKDAGLDSEAINAEEVVKEEVKAVEEEAKAKEEDKIAGADEHEKAEIKGEVEPAAQ